MMDIKIKEAYTPRQIVDAIKINVELASVNGKPITAEVSMGEASKDYIIGLIEDYAIEESRKAVSSIKEDKNESYGRQILLG